MKLTLGLVDAFGNVLGKLMGDGGLHVHSERLEPLDRSVPGVGRKGDLVRVPHPLEDPAFHSPDDHADAGADTHLALLGETDDGNGGVATKVFRIFKGACAVVNAIEGQPQS